MTLWAFGGTADRVWRGEVASASGAEVLEIPNADHALEIEDDPIQSVRILGQVTEAVDQFVVRL